MTRPVAICGLSLLPVVLLGCGGSDTGEKNVKITGEKNVKAEVKAETVLRALSSQVGRGAEEKGDLHEAEKHYKKAIQYAEEEGYVSESLHEDLHRVQERLREKYK